MMLFDYKRRGCGGQYQVRVSGSISAEEGNEHHTICEYENTEYLDLLDMEHIYGFAFSGLRELPQQADLRENTEKRAPVRNKQGNVLGAEIDFHLELFLEALGAWHPPHDMYVKLIMFFANTNLTPEYVAHMCNLTWNPPGHQSSETITMIRRYKGASNVTRGTAQWVLKKFATQPYNLKKIFPAREYKHYNDYIQFVCKLNRREDIQEFLSQTVGYVFKGKQYVWRAYTIVRDKHSRQIRNSVYQLSKLPPFTKSDDLLLDVFPSRVKLIGSLEDRVDSKIKDKAAIELYQKIHTLRP